MICAKISHLASVLLNILFPPACLYCGQKVSHANCLCSSCYVELLFCKRCEYLDLDSKGKCVLAIFVYEGLIKDLILSYKFSGNTYLSVFFAKFFRQAILSSLDIDGSVDFIVFVPMHRVKFFVRGYNQVALIAKELATKCDAIVLYDALVKVRNTKVQSLMPYKQRVKNVKGAFLVSKKYEALIAGKRVLLIDDVCTSGATISECVGELERCLPERVVALSLATASS